jgi:hypothetical protein
LGGVSDRNYKSQTGFTRTTRALDRIYRIYRIYPPSVEQNHKESTAKTRTLDRIYPS